ncbi:unnamed protein product [Didymodactylos carnosus]|uniref:Lipase n=1 Tax=Didymodactylos carnosus TaxID=1234261 RepID=A0A814VYU9_9BILA|nr:unnamed protein product [Didymodactylos carnosus]CAF1195306.1 unnamed protein product [Didymodactylos carnosus]CAF3838017.1 unnamed protein product [Didymodactylos carnosus]CAF3959701.1 unnamed protein product [Didymodactylos carnosus]
MAEFYCINIKIGILLLSLLCTCSCSISQDIINRQYVRSLLEQPEVLQRDPDIDYNITDIIRQKGYPCEEHKVTTEDGYILGVFRIPYGKNGSATQRLGRPVLLQHGLLDSATTWVMNFPAQSLGFILADQGYDVWLGNMRGNYYSRHHVKWNPDRDEEFWDFSYDEMAKFDLPNMIQYILSKTNYTQLAYVGHSQGTMIAFAEFGRNMDLNKNVSFYAALAPVAEVGHIKSPIRHLADLSKDIEKYWHLLFGRNEFLPSSAIVKWLAVFACTKVVVDRLMCENILFILCGPDSHYMNHTRVPVYIAHEPDGTSVKNMIHFAQGVQDKQFQAYDYGSPDKNELHYNQTTPPVYTITNMKIPTALFWSGEDWLADPEDVSYIFANIQSLVYEKYIPDYNHLDFVWAINANDYIYKDLINIMKEFHPPN